MNYYYPIDDEIKVFKYINPTDSELTEYWKITTKSKNGNILTESYDSKFVLYNTFEEQVYPNNADLIRYTDTEKLANGGSINIESDVMKKDVYKSDKLNPYNYAVSYKNNFGKFTFEKKRQFVGFEEVQISKTLYQSAKFKDEYFINAIDQNDKYEFYQITYYAKGIGMVKYERHIPSENVRILELEEIMSESKFNIAKKKASL